MAEEEQPRRLRGRGRRGRYRREMCNTLPSMFENGESVAEVCHALNVTKRTFYDWVNKYPDFKRAYEHGLHLSEAWWMRLGRIGAAGQIRNVNAALWIFNMKNRFKWRNVPPEEGDGTDGTMSPEEFAQRAADALDRMERADSGELGLPAGAGTMDEGVDAASQA